MIPKSISLNGTEFRGRYDKNNSIGALWVVCWNIRNFSRLLWRGATGRGIDLLTRMNQLIKYVRLWKPDVMFILECGPDADEACTHLEKNLDVYIARNCPSADKDGDPERYIVLYKQQIASSIVKGTPYAPYGDINGKYRRPVLLRLNIKGNSICLLALHAPSPVHPLKDRLSAMQKAICSAITDFPNDDIVLCGDLNIKSNEWTSLDKELSKLGCQHAGPLVTNSNVTSLVETSLCRFTTIMKTGESESQPYDQIWFMGRGTLTIPSCYSFVPDLSVKAIYENFWGWISREVKELSLPEPKLPKYDKPGLNEKKAINATDKLLASFSSIRRRVLDLAHHKQWLTLIQKEPVLSRLKSYQDKLDSAMEARAYPSRYNSDDPNVSDYSPGTCDYVKDLLEWYIEVASMVLQLYEAYKNNDNTTVVTSTFEMAMSDHLPVAFCFKW